MPLIPVIGRQKQGDLCEYKASLVYVVSSRPARDALKPRNPVSKRERERERERQREREGKENQNRINEK